MTKPPPRLKLIRLRLAETRRAKKMVREACRSLTREQSLAMLRRFSANHTAEMMDRDLQMFLLLNTPSPHPKQ